MIKMEESWLRSSIDSFRDRQNRVRISQLGTAFEENFGRPPDNMELFNWLNDNKVSTTQNSRYKKLKIPPTFKRGRYRHKVANAGVNSSGVAVVEKISNNQVSDFKKLELEAYEHNGKIFIPLEEVLKLK